MFYSGCRIIPWVSMAGVMRARKGMHRLYSRRICLEPGGGKVGGYYTACRRTAFTLRASFRSVAILGVDAFRSEKLSFFVLLLSFFHGNILLCRRSCNLPIELEGASCPETYWCCRGTIAERGREAVAGGSQVYSTSRFSCERSPTVRPRYRAYHRLRLFLPSVQL